MHMAQLMPLPLTVSCSSKIQIGLPFWYRLTRVVLDKGPLNECSSNMKLFVIKQSKGCKFMPRMHVNTFDGWAPPGPTGGAYALLPPPP